MIWLRTATILKLILWSTMSSATPLICVIDTGYNNEDRRLSGQVRKSQAFDAMSTRDKHGHGMAVLGVIDSISPDQPLLVCKNSNDSGRSYISNSIRCVNWCMDNGAKLVSMSFGSKQRSSRFAMAIAKGRSKGIRFVASAGNRGRKGNECSFPGLYEGVTNVGALDKFGRIAPFSSTDCKVDEYRIGVNVRTYSKSGGWVYKSGTSFAAPRVAAEYAMMKNGPASVPCGDLHTDGRPGK